MIHFSMLYYYGMVCLQCVSIISLYAPNLTGMPLFTGN